MDVIMMIIIVVLTLICLGSFDSMHYPSMIIWKQGFVMAAHLSIWTLLWRALNCMFNNIDMKIDIILYIELVSLSCSCSYLYLST